ncbi:ribonuclease R [Planctomycetota bacterium]|nr:ribonuclease R [Planctomycetota bacterium]
MIPGPSRLVPGACSVAPSPWHVGQWAPDSIMPRQSSDRSAIRRRRTGAELLARSRQGADTQEVLDSLHGIAGGGTAGQIAQHLGNGADPRDVSVALRRLVEQGQVLEVRPGRYQASGSGGEHAVTLQADASGGLAAVLPDGSRYAVHPHYRLGAKAGDVCQILIGEDRLALVTRILRRSGREVVGAVNFLPGGPVLVADNRREGTLPIRSTFARFDREYQAGDRVVGVIEIDAEGRAGVNVTRVLGQRTPEVADFEYVRLVHDLPGDFPPEVVAQAEAYGKDMPLLDRHGNQREDLREKLILTIDPETAKDFDDAISLERDHRGNWIVGVHIADVSHFVDEHSPLDQEAARRGTSIYLVNRVIPMLPEALSNGLCSLVPKQDRYCLSAFLTLEAKSLRLLDTRLAETVINSRHRLSYEQALAVLERRERPGEWPEDALGMLRDCSKLAQQIRAQRERAGALNLFSVEHRFTLDVEGNPIATTAETTDIAHQLIEELMLLANRAVAAWLGAKGLPCVFRVHEAPDPERLKVLQTLLETYGLEAQGVETRPGLQKILGRIAKEPRAPRLVLNLMMLRSFKRAIYTVENNGHYALAFSDYCHFTSPIRRYPDLLVHRLAKRALNRKDFERVEIRPAYLDSLARQASWLEQRAEDAERDLDARKAARYLARRIGEVVPAVVTGASGGALYVQILETGLEGVLPIRELHDDFYRFDPDRMALVGSRSGRVYGIGTELDVLIAHVDIERADVVFARPENDAPTHRAAPMPGRKTKLTISQLLDRRKHRGKK